jgi:AraC-like DNA-binding protein
MDARVERPQAEDATVVYKTFVPPPPYDRFIENIWYWEGFDPGHAKDTIMASGRIGIMINLKEDALTWYDGERYGRRNRIPGIAVCGTHSTHFAIDAYQASNMGVQFRPGGAFAFFGGSARDFTNAHISLADIWGADAHRLHQRLVQAPTAEDKIAILFRAMVERYQERERHPAVSLALQRMARAPHRTSMRAIAREAEVSAKRLIHLFAEQVGTTPKLYLRVLRFQRVLERVHTAPSVDWMEEVERHGYYDQPHFIREFHEFSGFTPTEYFKLRGPYRQHVPLTV